MFSTDITITDARCGPETHVVIDMLKLRYEWSNYKHLRERNEAAGITKKIIDKVLTSDLLLVIPPLPRLCLPFQVGTFHRLAHSIYWRTSFFNRKIRANPRIRVFSTFFELFLHISTFG